jgi:hypothetical protein
MVLACLGKKITHYSSGSLNPILTATFKDTAPSGQLLAIRNAIANIGHNMNFARGMVVERASFPVPLLPTSDEKANFEACIEPLSVQVKYKHILKSPFKFKICSFRLAYNNKK